MSRRQQNPRSIRGPQSALTDYLASNNINATLIRTSYEARRAQAAQAAQQAAVQQAAQQTTTQALQAPQAQDAEVDGATNGESGKENDVEPGPGEQIEETVAETKKRKKRESAAISKIKQSKESKRRKASKAGEPDDDDDYLGMDMFNQKSRPVPGQLENCEICSKRFTVTPYSKEGPEGGLLCAQCSKKVKDGEKKDNKPKQRAVPRKQRRQNQSNLLDGIAQGGPKSLVDYCLKAVAKNIADIDALGDLPPRLLDRLSQLFSKHRMINHQTLEFFIKSEYDTLAIYDCANLEDDEYHKIFVRMPNLETINLRNAGQVKDDAIKYMVQQKIPVKHLQLHGSNLISDDAWKFLFEHYGLELLTLKLSWLDCAFDDDTLEFLVDHCQNLSRLKLKKCFKIGDRGLNSLGKLQKLEHLSLDLPGETSEREVIYVVDKTGSNLLTLSLEKFTELGDEFLTAVKQRCQKLEKLRFTDNSICTDQSFANLFTNWANPALHFIDFSSNRDVDNANPNGPAQPVGLASAGFTALMAHSASKIAILDISSCRHITHAAFSNVFDGVQQYPCLLELNISFLTIVDDFIVGCIFKSCPKLVKLTAFGCFNVKEVLVPAGVALIGVPNAQDTIVIQGDYIGEL